MASTYTLTQIVLPHRTILVGSGCEFYTVDITYPTDTVPYWTIALTRRDTTTHTIYATQATILNPA